MSATIGRIDRRTISFRASPPRLSGTATRAISQPASCRSSIWRIVASTSWVSVVHIDWTSVTNGGATDPDALGLAAGPRRGAVLRQVEVDVHGAHSQSVRTYNSVL